MQRKYICICGAAITLLLLSVAASGQVGALSGYVQFRLANGEAVSVEGATIDVFRTDLPGKYHTTTGKTGKFVFAGLPFAGVYLLTVSAPDARPQAISNVKAGRDIEYEITLEPGDGKQLTLEEARALVSGLRLSEEGAAKDRERVETTDDILNRTFKAGNEALRARQFDEAVKQFDEGIAAAQDQLALQPAFWVNKSVALRSRGVEKYNSSFISRDEAAKAPQMEAAKKEFRDAADAAAKAVEILKMQAAPTDPVALKNYEASKYFALASRAEAMRLFVKVDPAQASTGLAVFQEYIETETDPARKSGARLEAAVMLLDANATDQAIEEFQKILAAEPDNLEATFGMGRALYQSGNKNRFSEAEHYLQRFINNAPDTHPMKQAAQEILEQLRVYK
jgi:tetratricopeptide (TPR) repeat protein